MLTFCDYPGLVEAANNESKRALCPSVIQRKVTTARCKCIVAGYCAMWAAQAKADVRTTIDAARLTGASPFQAIIATLV